MYQTGPAAPLWRERRQVAADPLLPLGLPLPAARCDATASHRAPACPPGGDRCSPRRGKCRRASARHKALAHHESGVHTLHDGKRRSLLGGLAATIAITGSVLSSAPAVAAPPDPTATNLPGLGWRGERLRSVACSDALASATSVGFAVEDWSGDPLRTPQEVPGSVSLFTGTGEHAGQQCAAGSFITQGAGMAQIRLIGQD